MEKQCRVCNEVKPISQFTKHKAVCKECRVNQTTISRQSTKENINNEKNIDDPNMIYIHKKIKALNDLFMTTIPTIDDLKHRVEELNKACQAIADKTIMFYFPVELDDDSKKYLKTALTYGLNVDGFKYKIMRNETEFIEKELGLKMHKAYECLDKIEQVSNMMNAIREGYLCINKYVKHSMRNPGTNHQSNNIYIAPELDVDASCIILKQNPMQLTIPQFISEIRKIIIEYDEILVVQFNREPLCIYEHLLTIGKHSLLETKEE